MCQKRSNGIIKRGPQKARLREARRLQRMQQQTLPNLLEQPRAAAPCPQNVSEQEARKNAFLELAYKTMVLMERNKLIQEKIDSLKKETSEFVAIVMSNPENRRRYLENLKLYGSQVLQAQQNLRVEATLPFSLPIKLEKV